MVIREILKLDFCKSTWYCEIIIPYINSLKDGQFSVSSFISVLYVYRLNLV